MVMRPTPLPQDPTNYANAGLNIFNAMSAGNNIYTENQLRDAQEQAGGLAAAGDYDGARNAMLARGYPGQAVQYQGLASAARTRQEEATTKSLNSQVGGLLAAGRRQEAAQMLYQAGRLDDARKVMQQGQADQDTAQTAQKTTLTQQAGAAAAQGDWDTAAKLAYQAGDIKTAGFYQEKAQEGQKAQTYRELAKTQALRTAVAAAKSQADYDNLHDAFEAAGYDPQIVAKYRDFTARDKHAMELDAHQKDLEGRLAPEDREKAAKGQRIAQEKLPIGYRQKFNADGTVAPDASGRGILEPIPGGPAEKETAETAFKHAQLNVATDSLARAEKYFVGDEKNPPNTSTTGMLFSAGSAGDALRAVNSAIEAYLRGTSGAAVSEQEMQRARDLYAPGVMDTDITRKRKLEDLKRMLKVAKEKMELGRGGAQADPSAALAAPRPKEKNDDQLRAEAQQAIAKGANPADVEAQLRAWGVK
jgi:hypothetical protein